MDSTFKSLFGKRHDAMVSFCSNYTPPVVISSWSVFCIIRYKARRLENDLYRSAFRPDKGNINNFDVKETDWEI